MSREWMPGDLALVDSWRGKGQIACRTQRGQVLGWCVLDGTDTRGLDDLEVANARPIVVIYPEDREQVERLTRASHDAIHKPGAFADLSEMSRIVLVDLMQVALRSLGADPKPEEPTDPKVRVGDRRENIWRLLADGDWVCTSGPDIGEYLDWARLTQRGPLSVATS